MSAIDARLADQLLAGWRPSPKTKAEREQEKRARERREFTRLVETIRRRMSLQANVSRAELLSEGFDARTIDGSFARAARAAGAHGMAS